MTVRKLTRSSLLLLFLIYLFIFLPLITVVAYSFNSSRFGAGWRGFTTKWYWALFDNSDLLQYVVNSLILATSSTLIATFIGSLLGFGLSRSASKNRLWILLSLYLPVIVSDIVMALSLVTFFSLIRSVSGLFDLGLSTMIIAHVTFQIPFVALTVKARLEGLDPKLDEAAADLGATPFQTAIYVILPLALPGIIAGALMAFTLSLDDFVVSFFTAGPGSTTLPIMIYSSVKRGITPEINALSTLMIIGSVLLGLMSVRFQRATT